MRPGEKATGPQGEEEEVGGSSSSSPKAFQRTRCVAFVVALPVSLDAVAVEKLQLAFPQRGDREAIP